MFSPANSKLKKLYDVPELQKWIKKKRVYSFDLLSGHCCPFANECKSKAIEINGTRKIRDGKNTKFRCFSASQEVLLTNVYNHRKKNYESLKNRGPNQQYRVITSAFPMNAGIIRIHVSGDFFNQTYFDTWLRIASELDDVLFYAYTKSIPYWINRLEDIPENFILTASRGGKRDDLISEFNLREAKVIYEESEAEYEIDYDDSHACVPEWKNNSFNLLIHGIQPKNAKKNWKNS